MIIQSLDIGVRRHPCTYRTWIFHKEIKFASKVSLNFLILQSLLMALRARQGGHAPASSWVRTIAVAPLLVVTNSMLVNEGTHATPYFILPGFWCHYCILMSQSLTIQNTVDQYTQLHNYLTRQRHSWYRHGFEMDLMPSNSNIFMSKRNDTFWPKVGQMGVGEMGVGEPGPILSKVWEMRMWGCEGLFHIYIYTGSRFCV